jgi:hypothetical protein
MNGNEASTEELVTGLKRFVRDSERGAQLNQTGTSSAGIPMTRSAVSRLCQSGSPRRARRHRSALRYAAQGRAPGKRGSGP